MALYEILDGLRNGLFHQGDTLESEEGFWFTITDDDYLLGKTFGEIFEIGKLVAPPAPRLNNS